MVFIAMHMQTCVVNVKRRGSDLINIMQQQQQLERQQCAAGAGGGNAQQQQRLQ